MNRRRFFRWISLPLSCWLLVLTSVVGMVVLNASTHTSVAHADGSTTITPGTTNDVLMNPGKGWVYYWSSDYGAALNSTLPPYTALGYFRYNWLEIEPSEGQYNWSIIDNDIQTFAQRGLPFAFGVMNANSSDCPNGVGNTYITPKWVFDAGAQYTASTVTDNNGCPQFTQYEPVWSDSIYLQKLDTFLTALAQHYDGNSNLAFIDDRSYGNWGEQHVADLSGSPRLTSAQLESQMQMYLNHFTHTQIIVPNSTSENDSSVYLWAAQHNIGLRNDGIPNYTDGTSVAPAQGYVPGIVEYGLPYPTLKSLGQWNSQTVSNDILNNAHASYAQYGYPGDAEALYNDNPQFVAT